MSTPSEAGKNNTSNFIKVFNEIMDTEKSYLKELQVTYANLKKLLDNINASAFYRISEGYSSEQVALLKKELDSFDQNIRGSENFLRELDFLKLNYVGPNSSSKPLSFNQIEDITRLVGEIYKNNISILAKGFISGANVYDEHIKLFKSDDRTTRNLQVNFKENFLSVLIKPIQRGPRHKLLFESMSEIAFKAISAGEMNTDSRRKSEQLKIDTDAFQTFIANELSKVNNASKPKEIRDFIAKKDLTFKVTNPPSTFQSLYGFALHLEDQGFSIDLSNLASIKIKDTLGHSIIEIRMDGKDVVIKMVDDPTRKYGSETPIDIMRLMQRALGEFQFQYPANEKTKYECSTKGWLFRDTTTGRFAEIDQRISESYTGKTWAQFIVDPLTKEAQKAPQKSVASAPPTTVSPATTAIASALSPAAVVKPVKPSSSVPPTSSAAEKILTNAAAPPTEVVDNTTVVQPPKPSDSSATAPVPPINVARESANKPPPLPEEPLLVSQALERDFPSAEVVVPPLPTLTLTLPQKPITLPSTSPEVVEPAAARIESMATSALPPGQPISAATIQASSSAIAANPKPEAAVTQAKPPLPARPPAKPPTNHAVSKSSTVTVGTNAAPALPKKPPVLSAAQLKPPPLDSIVKDQMETIALFNGKRSIAERGKRQGRLRDNIGLLKNLGSLANIPDMDTLLTLTTEQIQKLQQEIQISLATQIATLRTQHEKVEFFKKISTLERQVNLPKGEVGLNLNQNTKEQMIAFINSMKNTLEASANVRAAATTTDKNKPREPQPTAAQNNYPKNDANALTEIPSQRLADKQMGMGQSSVVPLAPPVADSNPDRNVNPNPIHNRLVFKTPSSQPAPTKNYQTLFFIQQNVKQTLSTLAKRDPTITAIIDNPKDFKKDILLKAYKETLRAVSNVHDPDIAYDNKTKQMQISASTPTPDDTQIGAMVASVTSIKNKHSCTVKNCENNLEAGLKLYLLAKEQGLDPKIEEPALSRMKATHNSPGGWNLSEIYESAEKTSSISELQELLKKLEKKVEIPSPPPAAPSL